MHTQQPNMQKKLHQSLDSDSRPNKQNDKAFFLLLRLIVVFHHADTVNKEREARFSRARTICNKPTFDHEGVVEGWTIHLPWIYFQQTHRVRLRRRTLPERRPEPNQQHQVGALARFVAAVSVRGGEGEHNQEDERRHEGLVATADVGGGHIDETVLEGRGRTPETREEEQERGSGEERDEEGETCAGQGQAEVEVEETES